MEDGIQKNPQAQTANSQLLFWCRPSLLHQGEQMLERFLIAASFFGGKLTGALVELRGHVGGFLRRTAEGDEDLGKFGNLHGNTFSVHSNIFSTTARSSLRNPPAFRPPISSPLPAHTTRPSRFHRDAA